MGHASTVDSGDATDCQAFRVGVRTAIFRIGQVCQFSFQYRGRRFLDRSWEDKSVFQQSTEYVALVSLWSNQSGKLIETLTTGDW